MSLENKPNSTPPLASAEAPKAAPAEVRTPETLAKEYKQARALELRRKRAARGNLAGELEGQAADNSLKGELASLGEDLSGMFGDLGESLGMKFDKNEGGEEGEEDEEGATDAGKEGKAPRSKLGTHKLTPEEVLDQYGEIVNPGPVFGFRKKPGGTLRSTLTSVKGHRKAKKTKTGYSSTDHKGYDIGVPEGTPIALTAESATVKKVKTQVNKRTGQIDGAGHYVVLTLADGSEATFMHLRELPDLKEHQVLNAGDLIAFSGNTGSSSGPHLHFEIRQGGVAVEPEGYLAEVYHKEHEDELQVA